MSFYRLKICFALLPLSLSAWACEKAEEAPSGVEESALVQPKEKKAPKESKKDKMLKVALVEKALPHFESRSFYGVYMFGQKVGHASFESQKTDAVKGAPYTIVSTLNILVKGAGTQNEMKLKESRYYEDKAPYALVESHYESETSGVKDSRKAYRVVEDGGTSLKVVQSVNGGTEKTRLLPESQDTLASSLATFLPLLDELKEGEAFSYEVFDWTVEGDESVAAKVLSRTERVLSGVSETLYEMEEERSGIIGKSKVTKDGVALEIAMGPSLILKLEDEALAKSDLQHLDILSTALPSPKKLGAPQKISALRLSLSSKKPMGIPSKPGQKVKETKAEDGSYRYALEIKPSERAPMTEEEKTEALYPTAAIDSDHPKILERAKAITKGLNGDREKAEAIVHWVYRHLKKQLATALPTASSVLEEGLGDCTEHSDLASALLRASGIPARPVYGVVYAGDESQDFAYHAWIEVGLDGAWQMMDPTWNEVLANATHLQLGEHFAEVGSALGAFELESIEVLSPSSYK